MPEGRATSDQISDREATSGQRSVVEIARAGYEAWNTGDLETFLEFVHPEVVWVPSGLFPGLRSGYSGRAGIREFWSAFAETWETLEIEMEKVLEVDEESVLIRARFHARGRDGIEVERRIINHMVFRNGKLYRFRGYGDWEEALAELGIEGPREQPNPQP
jgi:ketosteroid isomerase-like protein